MYRIIGITDGSQMNKDLGLVKGQLKLIKAIPISEIKSWYSSNLGGNWNGSELKSYLNGAATDDFLTDAKNNQWKTGDYWDSLITSQKWYMELKAEYPWPSTNPLPNTISEGYTEGKVGLMYASDYYNSGSQDTNNWLYVKNGWSTSSSLSGNFIYEWTMSRNGITGVYYAAWAMTIFGYLYPDVMNYTYAVRPVFYLTPNITLTGEGTSTNPFIISV